MELTENQKIAYVASGGVGCPVCKSENITAVGSMEVDGADAWQKCTCENEQCQAEWSDIYRLVGAEVLE